MYSSTVPNAGYKCGIKRTKAEHYDQYCTVDHMFFTRNVQQPCLSAAVTIKNGLETPLSQAETQAAAEGNADQYLLLHPDKLMLITVYFRL